MEHKSVNKSKKRVDAYEKVTGKAKFGADLYFDRMLYGKVLRTEYPHAKILKIRTKEAEKVKGVKAVLTADDIPNNEFGVIIENQQVLAKNKAMYIGDGVALVAAETKKAAKKALELIEVEYKELEGIYDPLEARKKGAKAYGVIYLAHDKTALKIPPERMEESHQYEDLIEEFEEFIF